MGISNQVSGINADRSSYQDFLLACVGSSSLTKQQQPFFRTPIDLILLASI